MKLRLLAVLVLAVAILCGCCGVLKSIPLSGRELAAKEADETVALVFMDDDKENVYCSGVFVSNSVILTAAHCIFGYTDFVNEKNEEAQTEDTQYPILHPEQITFHFAVVSEYVNVGVPTSGIHSATVLETLRSEDLALLSITNPKSLPKHSIAKIAKETPKQGDFVSCMGHPDRFYWSYIQGTVSAIRDDIKYVPTVGPFIQISAPVWKGMSGGCAFDAYGSCIGIASFLNPNSPDMSFYIDTETVRGLLIGARIIKADLGGF
jgi:S1-C subfamily serine protease